MGNPQPNPPLIDPGFDPRGRAPSVNPTQIFGTSVLAPGTLDLSLPTDETLLAASAPNPRTEHERLAAGNPREITELGEVFARAGGDMDTAYQLSQQAQQWVGQGYTNDGTPVYDQTDHVRVLPRNFPDASAQLVRIAGRLGEIAVNLDTTTTNAASMLNDMIGVLGQRRAAWAQRVEGAKNSAGLIPFDMIDALVAERDQIAQGMQTLTNLTGQDISGIIATYEGDLADGMTMLADIGYLPPDAINTGPGGEEFSITGAATDDAEDLAAAMDLPPGSQSQAGIEAATEHFRYLNEKLDRGDQLTADDRAYINQFTSILGADDLAALPEQVRQNVAPQGIGDTSINQAAQEYLDTVQPISNALMATGTGTVDTTVTPGDGLAPRAARYEDMPAAFRELVDTRAGADSGGGGRAINAGALLPGDDPGANPNVVMNAGVAGMDRIRGVADLVGAATVVPSASLSQELTQAAVRTKQDLNSVQDSAGWMLATPSGGTLDGPEAAAARLDAMVDDRPLNTMLSVAARNNEGSSAALLDPATRAPLLGLNWEAADGAAAVVAAGTERDTAAGGGTETQARAALAVIQEVASDPEGYNNRMSAPVVEAVNDVGSDYIDAFAASPADTGYVGDRVDSLGRPVGPSFQLTQDDSTDFLRYVAGSGDDRQAQFQAEAKVHSHTELTNALAEGNNEQINTAMNAAGRLDGAITQASFDHALGEVDNADTRAAAAQRAAEIEATADQGLRSTLVVAGRELLNDIPGVSSVTAVGAEILKGFVRLDTLPPVPPPPELPGATRDLTAEAEAVQLRNRDLLLAGALAESGGFTDRPAPAILTADNTGPQGVPDGLVDPPGTSSNLQDQLFPAVRTTLAERGLDPDSYDNGRSQTYSGEWSGPARQNSEWSGSDRLYYGSETPPDGPLGTREPDPRRFDDPGYDPLHQARGPR